MASTAGSILEPYNCCTENPDYLEFYDKTQELETAYAKTMDCIKLPEGRIISVKESVGKHRYVIRDGDMVSGLYTDCDILLKKVRETGRDVLRLIIPDKYNHFPEDPDCKEPYKHQELNMFEE